MTSKSKGFTLIEVLISFILIGVGSLGLIKLQVYVEQRAEYAKHSLEALYIAEQQMEIYRGWMVTSSGVSTIVPFSDMNNASYCRTDLVPSGSIYTLTCDASTLSVSNSVRTVTVSVNWKERYHTGNEEAEVKLETMISKYSEF